MDDEDYSWVRRTRFSQSIVRSSSGREQYGAFIEQFSRGAELKLNGLGTGRRLPGQNLQPLAKGSVLSNSASARLTIPKAKSAGPQSERKLKHASSEGQMNRDRSSDRSLRQASPKQDRKGAGLSLDIPQRHAVRPSDDESPDALDFSFHSDEQSQRLQRVCSSPAPFYSQDAAPPVDDSRARSASMKGTGEVPKPTPQPKRRAKSPIPKRAISDVFKEAKAATKRFSSPQRQRKPTSPRSPDDSPPFGFASLRTPSKLKINRRTSSWPRRNFDDGPAKVAASDILERWTVDRSQLLIGHRFASGAYSRLFHGIYKEQPVAVKFIRQPDDGEDDELSARLEKQFTAEVTILARLQHRNVIKLVGACNCPPVFCVITEFLSGGSLRAFLRKLERKTLPMEKVISIALDIARGLEYIHLQGIVHRDVKPENILFDGEFCAKVVDFGVACEEAHCNLLGDDPGTYRWMAPEMYKHKPYGRKVDVYSFGLVLWELVTGTLPYEDMTPLQAAFAVVSKNLRPAIPSSCPAAVKFLIEQCWSWQPEKRPEFQQIVSILENLKTVLERDGTLDKIPSFICQPQECNDQNKKKVSSWIQRLSYTQPDFSGPPPPKLL
ncbi:serine/threonine-protein kinase HT1-like [Panicum miliaceum]|uniref:Serine/threonine-protein kinase HT1-like n=1 Tax=Panicum miliaceum TaxID=4540 RepID=A0A3L6RCR5_PANMI|nr:serine/threonine-protein kinase HT1-like [Panicum miliaceum]